MPENSPQSKNVHEDPSSVELTALRLFEKGEPDLALQSVAKYLDNHAGDIDPAARSALARIQFEIARNLPDHETRREAAIQWLESIAEEGEIGWLPILGPEIRQEIEASFVEPLERLEWLELLSFAPPNTGLSDEALALIEDFGYQHASDSAQSREAERLLHALGQRDAAYRVERARRAAQLPNEPARKQVEKDEIRLPGLTIAIAGGHPALRRAIHNDLLRAGAKEVRDIPPRWEGSRQGREVVALIGGSDVAVLIGRHISHSTVDQVKRGAALAGIPVLASHTASASGVRKALEEHLKSNRLDKPSRPT